MTKQRTALITGITGQDGSHLADYLQSLGYSVHGVVRRTSSGNLGRLKHLLNDVVLHEGDVTDQGSLIRIVDRVTPDEVYNLAAQSFVGVSWDQPVSTMMSTGVGAVNVLEAAKRLRESGRTVRVYQASTSEMFGNSVAEMQSEETPFKPRSPYGCAKLYAHSMANVYRESFGMFIACGILFNHEGPRRGEEFVTRKITTGVAEIAAGNRDFINLGNLDAQRDWGYAPDYVQAMHKMLQLDEPVDLVIATGVRRSVRDFLQQAFLSIGETNWEKHVTSGKADKRPAELYSLCGDASKAHSLLGWKPETNFEEWVKIMVDADVERLANQPDRVCAAKNK